MGVRSSLACLFFFIALNGFSFCAIEKTNSTFQPTNKWQKLEDGQSIPPGLHVRINLATGYKEAKLSNESDVKSALAKGEYENGDGNVMGIDYLELKNKVKEARENEKLGKLRSYDELVKTFKELNMQVQTDVEILTTLIDNFNKFETLDFSNENLRKNEVSEDEEILSTLVDLEYLVHQFDNAREFVKQNGFSQVIQKSLKSPNSKIRCEALNLHGSATQSNPKVQIAALESGSIELLLKLLSNDVNPNVRSKSLYAISCLVRRFPAAQKRLITDGGLAIFASVFDEETQDSKLKMKILTLLYDLLIERRDAKFIILEEGKNQTEDKLLDLKERIRQYDEIEIEKRLVKQNWCLRISNWFIKKNLMSDLDDNNNNKSERLMTGPTIEHHDLIEKVVDVLYVLSDICKSEFKGEKKLIKLLSDLREVYNKLAQTEISDDDDDDDDNSGQFYSSLSDILNILTDKLKANSLLKEDL